MERIKPAKSLRRRGGRPKFSDREHQFKICLWIAMGKTTKQVIDQLEDEYSISFAPQTIDGNYRYGKKWKKVIRYLKTRYLKNLSHIPIANKEYRLGILHEAMKEALTWRTKSISAFGTVEHKQIGILPAILREARIEIEGEKPLIGKIEHHTHYNFIQKALEKAGDVDADGRIKPRTAVATGNGGQSL